VEKKTSVKTVMFCLFLTHADKVTSLFLHFFALL